LATLTKWEIDLKSDPPRIARERRKTGVYGKWPLWPETADLLKARLAKTPKNEDDLAILTRNGKPLVHFGKGIGRTDSVSQFWSRLIGKTDDIQKLSFKYLRKTGADIVRKIAGRDISEAYLSHADQTMARAYTNTDFAAVADAVTKMREQLAPMFED
jgi:integrase